jgi:hypothetical protein
MDQTEAIDTANHAFIGARGDRVVSMLYRFDISKAEAMNLAAWLAVIAGAIPPYDGPTFKEVLREVEDA